MSLREITFVDYQTIQSRMEASGFSWISADQCLIPAQVRPDQADLSEDWGTLPKSDENSSVLEKVSSFESNDGFEKIDNLFLKELISAHVKFLISSKVTKSQNLDVIVKAQRVLGTKESPGEVQYVHQGAVYTAIHLIQRRNAKGGDLKIITDEGEELDVKTPTRLMDGVFLSESGVLLTESPILPVNRLEPAIRDFLILEYYPRNSTNIPIYNHGHIIQLQEVCL